MIIVFAIWLVGFVVNLILFSLSLAQVFPQTYTPWKVFLLSALWFYVWPYHLITKDVPFLEKK